MISKITIKVTGSHIYRGVPCSYHDCPISLSLKDEGYSEVFTGLYSGYLKKENEKTTHFKVNEEMRHFIRSFDVGLAVEPFTCEVQLED